jgi:glycosyltransferase involved in cell wall biosynthesis
MAEITRLIKGGLRRLRRVLHSSRAAFENAAIVAENATRPHRNGLVIIDDFFPSLATAFRVAEFNSILSHFETTTIYSAWTGVGGFSQYAERYPDFACHVRGFHPRRRLAGSAAYVVFLNNAFNYLECFETAKLPFVLELYPGGGFYLEDPVSDAHLRRVLESPMFRKVIVTQNVTRDYLVRMKFCREEQIEFVFGVVALSDDLQAVPLARARYGVSKPTLDICFVANKYMPRGVDKGYDKFIACARILRDLKPEARFHVVGDFTGADIQIGELRNRVKFYGHQFTPFFPEFYSRMDIILSPNAPFLFAPGAFDGFPTGCCIEAGLCGSVIFATDELGMNEGRLKDGEEIVIISREPEKIAELIGEYSMDPGRLARLAENGQLAIRRIFALEAQMAPRLRILSELLAGAASQR